MKRIEWNYDKNELLKSERNISFEDIVKYIKNDNIIDILNNPNNKQYENQKLLLVDHNDYIYYVPYIEDETSIFLKTIIPSRKLTKLYLRRRKK